METKNNFLLALVRNPKNNFLILDENIVWDSGRRGINWYPSDDDEAIGFVIENGYWYISKGWSWDGATMAPEGPEDPLKEGYPLIWLATLGHDLGIYFLNEEDDFPYSKADVDRAFFSIMLKRNSKLSYIYYWAVRIFGGLFHIFSKTFRKHKESKHDPIFLGPDWNFEAKFFLKCELSEL